ncbi:hypothetical protein PV703_03905 [Streptomyces sp. ME01-24h]|nr:hypothetical protein [Streptomyces sp. ME01-24h]
MVEEISGWRKLAVQIVEQREPVETAAEEAARQLLGRVTSIGTGGNTAWRALQLAPSDADLVTSLARRQALPELSVPVRQGIHQLTGDADRALTAVRALFGARRMFSGKSRKNEAGQAAAYLVSLHEQVASTRLVTELAGLAARDGSAIPPVGLPAVLDDSVGFGHRLGARAELVERHELDAARTALAAMDRALDRENEFRTAVSAAGDAVRQGEVRKLLAEMPVERLKDATSGQLRINALIDAGIRNVQQVLDQRSRLRSLPGVGETTGNRMVGAARTIWQTTSVLDAGPHRHQEPIPGRHKAAHGAAGVGRGTLDPERDSGPRRGRRDTTAPPTP